MRLFLDSADGREIRTCLEQGSIEGVYLPANAAASLAEVCDLVRGPVIVEAAGQAAEGLLRSAQALARTAPNVVVRVPLTADGLKVIRVCAEEKIATCAALCSSPAQALLAGKAGATYVSPAVGRVEETAADGVDLVRRIVAVYKTYGFTTQTLVTAVRNPNHIVDAALVGAQAAVVPFAVLQALVKQPLTDAGLGT